MSVGVVPNGESLPEHHCAGGPRRRLGVFLLGVPRTKNVKLYLVLTVGGGNLEAKGGDITGVVDGMEGVDVLDARKSLKANNTVVKKGSKTWIIKKKEQMERKGKVVKATSKYTGRKRRVAF